jgi:hypothetical protein
MTLDEIVNYTRKAILGNWEEPFYWRNDELVLYANEAQNTICRDARILEDSTTTAVCNISTTVGVLDYALHASIIYVRSAKISTGTRLLVKKTKYEKDNYYPGWRSSSNAEPLEYILDYQHGKITLWPPPGAVYTVNLSVFRYPVTALTTTAMGSQTPEIPTQYHHALINGIAYQAFMKQGENTYDFQKSDRYFQLFRKQITDMKIQDNLYHGNADTLGPKGGFI